MNIVWFVQVQTDTILLVTQIPWASIISEAECAMTARIELGKADVCEAISNFILAVNLGLFEITMTTWHSWMAHQE